MSSTKKFAKSNYLLLTVGSLNIALFIFFLLTKHFHTPLMLLHITSIILLWGWVLKRMKLLDVCSKHWKEVLLILSLVLVAFFVRIDRVEEFTPGMYADELTVAKSGLQLLAQSDFPP